MAIPIIGATLVGSVVAGVSAALATTLGRVLVGTGLTFIAVKGAQTIIGYLVQDINAALAFVSSAGGGAGGTGYAHLGIVALKMAAYAGLIDYINITVAGMLTVMAFKGLRVVLARATG